MQTHQDGARLAQQRFACDPTSRQPRVTVCAQSLLGCAHVLGQEPIIRAYVTTTGSNKSYSALVSVAFAASTRNGGCWCAVQQEPHLLTRSWCCEGTTCPAAIFILISAMLLSITQRVPGKSTNGTDNAALMTTHPACSNMPAAGFHLPQLVKAMHIAS